MRPIRLPVPPRPPTPRMLCAVAAACLLLALLVLAGVGLGPWWYALIVPVCVVCLLPLAPCVLLALRR